MRQSMRQTPGVLERRVTAPDGTRWTAYLAHDAGTTALVLRFESEHLVWDCAGWPVDWTDRSEADLFRLCLPEWVLAWGNPTPRGASRGASRATSRGRRKLGG